MSLFAAWVLYPVVLFALCAGAGLLADAACGRRVPGPLVPPLGLATIVVVGQFTTLSDWSAGLTAPLIVTLAIAGIGLSLPWRFGRIPVWPIAAAAAVFAAYGAPVIASGEPTFAGYIKLDDTATWLALTDRLMEHGRDISGLSPSTYRATLEFTLGEGYPVGAFIPFGVAQRLTGGDLAWVFQPYLSFLAAMLSVCLWQLAAGLFSSERLRGLTAFIAAQPALLFGYALWGGVKELAAAVFIALAAALAPAAIRASASRGEAIYLVIVAAALIGVLSIGGLVWIAPMLALLTVMGRRSLGASMALRQVLAFALCLAAFTIPVLIAGGFDPFQAGLTSGRELGNLFGSLGFVQVLGIWPSGDFRLSPSASALTAIFVALAIFAFVLGLWEIWRRRDLGMASFATGLIACVLIVLVGSPWVDAKALAIAAPVALLVVLTGTALLAQVDRVTGMALAMLVGAGVIWSNVLAYGGVNLAPYGQLRELEGIGDAFAGQGPALMTDYNPYGARHFLRSLDAEGASELRLRTVHLSDGGVAEKGEAVDTDELDLEELSRYRTLVLRHSPLRSRPPLPYRLAWTGRYYEVWQRPVVSVRPEPLHISLGTSRDPAAVPDCGEVGGLGLLALQRGLTGARLIAARHAPVYEAHRGSVELPADRRYTAWLEGSVRGSVRLSVDGRKLGEARHQLQYEGGFVELGRAHLDAGRHEIELHRGGPDLHPGSGDFLQPGARALLFVRAGGESGGLVTVGIGESERLCGRPWDWVEAIGSP